MPLTIDLAGSVITMTPAVAQLTALQSVVDAYNANERSGQAPFTVNQWVKQILLDRIVGAVDAHKRKEAKDAATTFETLSSADKQTILNLLGGKSPFA